MMTHFVIALISLSSITEQGENLCYCIGLHVNPVFIFFFFFSLLIVWAQVVALSANTALRCQSDNEVKYVGVWEMRKRETDGWQLKESWHKRKRMKKKKTTTENVSRRARTTARREAGLIFCICRGAVCQTATLFLAESHHASLLP